MARSFYARLNQKSHLTSGQSTQLTLQCTCHVCSAHPDGGSAPVPRLQDERWQLRAAQAGSRNASLQPHSS